MRSIAVSFLLVALCLPAHAQTATIQGRVLEAGFDEGLRGANVTAQSLVDSTQSAGAATGRAGFFELELPWEGPTAVRVSHLGFVSFADTVDATGSVDFGVVTLRPDVLDMEGVEIVERRQRMVIKGDTIEYFAGGFFVPRYTYAESLVEAIPGFALEGETVMYLGRPVDRVLIDGKAYYGRDVMEALQTLPIEMIEALQVYDQLPENRRFSGVDDGSREQVINLVTDPNKRNALTFNVGGSGGTADRYSAGAGLFNLHAPRNIRLNASSSNQSPSRGGGINRTTSGNVHYGNTWNENTRVRLNYRVGDRRDESVTRISREYLSDIAGVSTYDESRDSDSGSDSHTLSGSITHTFLEAVQFSLNPRLLVMRNNRRSSMDGLSIDPGTGAARSILTGLESESTSLTGGFSSDIQLGGDRKYGVSASINASFSDDNSESFQSSSLDPLSSFLTATTSDSESSSHSLSASLGVQRQFGDHLFWSAGIEHSGDNRRQDLRSYTNLDGGLGLVLDSTLSNDYDGRTSSSGLMTHLGFNRNKVNGGVSLAGRRQSRRFTEVFPRPALVEGTDYVVEASFDGNLNIGENARLNASYGVSSATPSAEDLQQVVDYSNPLFLSVGNPELTTRFTHTLRGRAHFRNPENQLSGSLTWGLSLSPDAIGTQTYYAGSADREILGILVPAGGQLSRQAHLGDESQWSLNGSVSRPLGERGTNTSLTFGGTWSERPLFVDGQSFRTRSNRYRGGLMVRGRFTERGFINLSYSASLSDVDSVTPAAGTDYVSHSFNGGLNMTTKSGLGMGVNGGGTIYERLGSDLDTRASALSLSASYRPPAYPQLHFSVGAHDLLNNGDRLARNDNGLYIESRRTNQIGRYMVFSIQWETRSFRPGRGVPLPPGGPYIR